MNTRVQAGYGILIALALFLGVNIIANQTLTSQRLDLTSNKLYTLSAGSRNILTKLAEPITLRFYYSGKEFAGVPQFLNYGTRVRDMLEEYAASSKGLIKLQVIDPEPFSEAEDQAVGFGIQQLPMNGNGEMGYLGLVGTNTTDDEIAIPFLNPEREDALEYEITKLIYNLGNPKKRVIGVLSELPIFSSAPDQTTGRPGSKDWGAVGMLKEMFDVRQLDDKLTAIDDSIDTLMLVHPKKLAPAALYAIDQFVLKGGKAIVFVDPLAEEDRPEPDANSPMAMPKTDSNLEPLFEKWGIRMASDKIAADLDAPVRVTFNSSRGPQEVDYLPWMQIKGPEKLNHDDFITNQLNVVNVGSAGVIEHLDQSKTTVTPLIKTGLRSGLIERDAVFFARDPNALLQNFKAEKSGLVLAARVTGNVDSAFPNGRPLDEKEKTAPPDPARLTASAKPINVIVVADTDILADRFWVRMQDFLGMRVPNPFANNADFLINAIDNLGGNDDLISLRSRGAYTRPFTVVEQIQRDAEAKFRDQEQALQSKLKETEAKLHELQQQRDAKGEMLLGPEQRKELELFRKEQIKTRKELRNVQHDLQKNIEQLGNELKLRNIAGVPLVVAIFAVAISWYRMRRRKAA